MMTTDGEPNGLLLDLIHSVGRIEGQNELILKEQGRASKSRKEQYEATDRVRAEVAELTNTVKSVSASVAEMKPDVDSMRGFRAQVAIAVAVIVSVVTGAFNLVVYGLTHMNEIKTALREFLR